MRVKLTIFDNEEGVKATVTGTVIQTSERSRSSGYGREFKSLDDRRLDSMSIRPDPATLRFSGEDVEGSPFEEEIMGAVDAGEIALEKSGDRLVFNAGDWTADAAVKNLGESASQKASSVVESLIGK